MTIRKAWLLRNSNPPYMSDIDRNRHVNKITFPFCLDSRSYKCLDIMKEMIFPKQKQHLVEIPFLFNSFLI